MRGDAEPVRGPPLWTVVPNKALSLIERRGHGFSETGTRKSASVDEGPDDGAVGHPMRLLLTQGNVRVRTRTAAAAAEAGQINHRL